jgi:anti-sigma regulatory factor (Ser/Thr protein kinase)
VSWQAGTTFDRTISAPSQARRFVRQSLSDWGLSELSERVVLTVSEVMTNAVTHGQGRVTLALSATDDRVCVTVADDGRGAPVMRSPDPERGIAGGWGLHLVDKLADSWGTETRNQQTIVWFEHWRLPGLDRPD